MCIMRFDSFFLFHVFEKFLWVFILECVFFGARLHVNSIGAFMTLLHLVHYSFLFNEFYECLCIGHLSLFSTELAICNQFLSTTMWNFLFVEKKGKRKQTWIQKTTTFQFVQIGAKQKTGNGTNNKKKSWKKWAFLMDSTNKHFQIRTFFVYPIPFKYWLCSTTPWWTLVVSITIR